MSKILQGFLFPRVVPAECMRTVLMTAAVGHVASFLMVGIFLALANLLGESSPLLIAQVIVFGYVAMNLGRVSIKSAWLTGIAMVMGVAEGVPFFLLTAFVGSANLWPFVTVAYVAILFVPIAVGCLLGVLLGWIGRGRQPPANDSEPS